MSCKVHVEPSGHEFNVAAGETILDAALRQGYAFPYGCRNGACGACKGKVLEGQVDYGDEEPMALDESEQEQGMALFCIGSAESDVVIEVAEVKASESIPVKTMPARIERLQRMNDEVMRVFLKLPDNERLQYLAGQYVDIILKDGRHRAFSIANSPHQDDLLELHIRRIKGGAFTDDLFEQGQEKDILRIEGPHGTFFLREDSERNILLMATGTGFGPVKAIVEHAIAEGVTRPIHLYWGARTRDGLYMDELARQWAAEHENIHYVPVLSRPDADWAGRSGYVQDAVMADFSDLSRFEGYACGVPDMVYTSKDILGTRGLDPSHFYSDAFEWAKD